MLGNNNQHPWLEAGRCFSLFWDRLGITLFLFIYLFIFIHYSCYISYLHLPDKVQSSGYPCSVWRPPVYYIRSLE